MVVYQTFLGSYESILYNQPENRSRAGILWYRSSRLSREQNEGKTVMLPLIVSEVEIPDFIEDKIYIDLRKDYYSGIAQLAGLVHWVVQV